MNIEAIDGTAVEGEDYNLNTNSVTFTEAQSIKYVKVPVIDNNVFDGSKNFQLKITSGDNHFIPSSPVFVTGRISDNDEPAEDEDYVLDGVNTETTIEVGQSWINNTQIKGRIESNGDEDWYETKLVANHCYQIDIWGEEMYERYKHNDAFHVDELTLEDPFLLGVYNENGIYLPGTQNDAGWAGDTPKHTLSFNKSGTYFLVASHDRFLVLQSRLPLVG